MEYQEKIFIAGKSGMVGSALERVFRAKGFENIVGPSSQELDLRRQEDVEAFFRREKPDYVLLAAAKVGGIQANILAPADFLYDNLQIQNNVISSAYRFHVKRLLFVAPSCCYPCNSPQPINESYLMNGAPEPTNEGFALAKAAGIKLCEYIKRQYGPDFFSVVACNLYGPNDSFDPLNSHFLSALIAKIHAAKVSGASHITLWGTGRARRELMYCDDFAQACYFLMSGESSIQAHINVGTGIDFAIEEIAQTAMDVLGYHGDIVYDTSKPDGIMQKLLDVTQIHSLGWHASYSLHEGIQKTYEYYLRYILNRQE